MPLFSFGTDRLKLAVPCREDLGVAAFQFVSGGHESDGAVQPGVVKRQRRLRPNAFGLERLVPPFDLAVALRIVRRGPHMGHAADANELLEVLGDELRAVVGDDAGTRLGEGLLGPLEDDLDVSFRHRLADLPVRDEAAASVQDATQVVKRAAIPVGSHPLSRTLPPSIPAIAMHHKLRQILSLRLVHKHWVSQLDKLLLCGAFFYNNQQEET